jgi:hypothetical protein
MPEIDISNETLEKLMGFLHTGWRDFDFTIDQLVEFFLSRLPPTERRFLDYEKHIQNNCYRGLLVVTPEFRKLMEKHGKLCRLCKLPFIPQSYWKQYCVKAHYPTEHVCGFCVYDMDSRVHSEILDNEYQDSF